MFDGVHRGHLCLIRQVADIARRRALTPLVVTMDRHPREVLVSAPMPLLTTHDERLNLLRHSCVPDIEVLRFTPALAALSAREFIREILRKRLNVSVLVMGYDHRFGHDGRTATLQDFQRWGAEEGVEILQAAALPDLPVSSSKIRQALQQGDIPAATRMLGRPYTIQGEVIPGKQIGRELGFPTANLLLPSGKLLPANGVYAVAARVGETLYPAMTSIGPRPTIDSDPRPTVETHIIGFRGNLYGAPLHLSLLEKIRDITPFPNRDTLIAQLTQDAATAQALFQKTATPPTTP